MALLLYGYMALLLYGYMALLLYGYMALLLYGYMALLLYGYMALLLYCFMALWLIDSVWQENRLSVKKMIITYVCVLRNCQIYLADSTCFTCFLEQILAYFKSAK